MVSFYKHDIPAWMDGTEALSDGAYRVYHVICQLIYLHEGPIMLNERGIAGRCNQSVKAFKKHLGEVLAAGKLALVDGRLSNERAALELENVKKNRENAAKGGQNSGMARQNSGMARQNSGQTQNAPAKTLKTNDTRQAPLQEDRSLKEKRREEYAPKPPLEMSDNELLGLLTSRLPDRCVWPVRNCIVLEPVRAVLREGADLEKHVLSAVEFESRQAAQSGRRIATWLSFEGPIRARMERDRRAAQPEAQSSISDAIWDMAVAKYRQTRHWSFGRDSLPPDDPLTKVPAHILAAHGYGRAAA